MKKKGLPVSSAGARRDASSLAKQWIGISSAVLLVIVYSDLGRDRAGFFQDYIYFGCMKIIINVHIMY